MTSPIVAFLPCRAGSERVPHKNTKPFANVKYGLIGIKLVQLLKVPSVDKICVSSNDPLVLEVAQSFGSTKIYTEKRPDIYASSSTTTDALIEYVSSLFKHEQILWTHVTSPFLNEKIYEDIVQSYLKCLYAGNDSLMTVSKIQKFIWDNNGPVNYNYQKEKWPRTQTISPWFEINSGAFLASAKIYKEAKNRIGKRPIMYELNSLHSIDIDDKDQFTLAEIIYKGLNG